VSVTRRLRFEILRRDNHTCRYCGASAPDVKLTVDHVVPVALGGGDEPSNLVTACQGCNAGKSSITPDAPIVEAVSDDTLRWARAMEQAAAMQAADHQRWVAYRSEFERAWFAWRTNNGEGEYVEIPDDWERTVNAFFAARLDIAIVTDTVDRAMRSATWNRQYSEFKLFAGICWKLIRERQEIAESLIAAEQEGVTE